MIVKTLILILLTTLAISAQRPPDTTAHESKFAQVNGIKINYLDFGGKGDVIVFLTGFGDTAHVYDWIAPKFLDKYRVLALTRRGSGESDKPETGFDADTLTDDVRLILDHEKIRRAYLIGHSAAGTELTHFASKYPKRTLKIAYLDAAYNRAEVPELEKRDPLQPPETPDLTTARGRIEDAYFKEMVKYDPTYKKIKCPVLNYYAIFEKHWAVKPDMPVDKQKAGEEFIVNHVRPYQRRNIDLFRRELPSARVIELTGTHHYFFRDPAKRDDVVTTIREFLEGK